MIEVKKLRELLRLDPDSGDIFRAVDSICGRGRVRVRAGTVAGSPQSQGYLITQVAGRKILNHRIAFALHHGRWPFGDVDHINGNRTDNRPCNLREASRMENLRNSRKHKDGGSGFKGVSLDKRDNRYSARIMIDGKQIALGYYDDAETAGYAYLSAALKHHGAFVRLS